MREDQTKRRGRVAVRILFVIYVIVLAYFLFFSERYGRTEDQAYRYNLIPFREIMRYLRYRQIFGVEYFIVNIVGNVMAFAPFGFLLPIVSSQNRDFLSVALYSVELSFGVELVQLTFQVGIFDVDDVIMNTTGCIIGYVCFILLRKKLKKLL